MSSRRVSIQRIAGGQREIDQDFLAAEEPLEIRVRGRAVSVTMRTPGNDDELAAGFLLSEGIVRSAADILSIEPCGRNEFGNLVNVQLSPMVGVDFEKLTRHVFASSSCGLCGKATIESLRGVFPPIESDARVGVDVLSSLPDKLRAAQPIFDETGAVHAAGLFDLSGQLLAAREDVGRHNAVDKLMGFALLRDLLPLRQHILLVSGRASFEIMQKARAGGVAIVAAVSGPSSLAVESAVANRQTLVGFVRGGRMNVYAGMERIA